MIKIALTNLGKYNEGRLVYTWLELPASDEELAAAFEQIGINEEYEEFFISDYETDLEGLKIDEYENLGKLNELAEALEALSEYDQEHLQAYMEVSGYNLEESLERFEDRSVFYSGMDLYDVAYELVEQCYNLPEIALRYFDYNAFARDLSFDGYTETSFGTIVLQ